MNDDDLPAGRFVLVVEDEPLIALDVQMMLEEHGYGVHGPAGSVEAALALLDRAQPDLAVLDLNLHGKLVLPVAERLRDLGVPFILASAYASADFTGHHGIFADVQRVDKPIHERHLLEALCRAATEAPGPAPQA
ncbi:response regulator [Paracoccus liaowanqingii]|nr:response regulator [Paracoccus liaowanqingii]